MLRCTAVLLCSGVLTACTPNALNKELTAAHLQQQTLAQDTNERQIPAPLINSLPLSKPKNSIKTEAYSVVVYRLDVHDILFALARDAKLNIDIHPEVSGTVTLNAIEQSVPQILARIAKQVDIRYEFDGANLVVMPDTPYLHHYQIDYVNMAREVSGTVATNTQIATSGLASGSGSVTTGSSNISRIEIRNLSKNQFWPSLEKNIKELLYETDKLLPEGSSETVISSASRQNTSGVGGNVGSLGNAPKSKGSKKTSTTNAATTSLASSPSAASMAAEDNTIVRQSTFREAASVIVNPESGVLTVRATARQHEKVQEFIDRVMGNARRQVLIEATIVEVQLADGYQQGIDWGRLRADGSGFSLSPPALTTHTDNAITPFIFRYTDNSNPLNLALSVKLLESFGETKVLSSPKLSVLNNQTATLKVSEEFVYFLVKTDLAAGSTTSNATTAVTTTPQSVSIGLFMSVTPQISDKGSITLNVRPSISTIADLKPDPNPSIPTGMQNLVPQIRTREIESVMRVESGEIAVLGGLMEDRMDSMNGRIPLLGALPVVGELFTQRSNSARRSELVIFLRPTIIHDASISKDYQALQGSLPGENFHTRKRLYEPFSGLGAR